MVQTPEAQLESVLTPTDHLSVGQDGGLMIESVSAAALLQDFGSPLYVFSEATLRQNYR